MLQLNLNRHCVWPNKYTIKSCIYGQFYKYRFGFNGQEKDDEVSGNGNTMTAEFWEYDARLGRRFNCDLVVKYWMSPYHAFSNKPILNTDPNGARDDKFYDEEGNMVFDDGKGNDNYVVSKSNYNNNYKKIGDINERSKKLKEVALRAYTSEEEAAKAWSGEGFSATRNDPNGFERVATILTSQMLDGTNLFVLGNTVTGEKGSDPAVQGQADPGKSKATVGGVDLLAKYSKVFKGVNAQYKYSPFHMPLGVSLGLMDNPIVGWNPIMENHYYWRTSGFVHTHVPRSDNQFSLSSTILGQYQGDIGYAMSGQNVYLVPTSSSVLTKMYLLNSLPMMYFKQEADAQAYIKDKVVTIPIKK